MENLIQGCPWAQNRAKLERAIAEVTASGKPVTEEAVKLVYIRLLGKLVEVAEHPVAEHPVEEAPRRGRRTE